MSMIRHFVWSFEPPWRWKVYDMNGNAVRDNPTPYWSVERIHLTDERRPGESHHYYRVAGLTVSWDWDSR